MGAWYCGVCDKKFKTPKGVFKHTVKKHKGTVKARKAKAALKRQELLHREMTQKLRKKRRV